MLERMLGFRTGESVGAVLERYKGNGPGFDLLRILLALYIFYGHALWIAGGADALGVAATTAPTDVVQAVSTGFTGWTRPFHVAAVPVFFALSGFLVSGSAMRLKSVSTFLAFRGLRILPALAIEVTLCAVLLGPLITQLSFLDYFSDHHFIRYFGNIFGFVVFELPGVFMENPVKGTVNANLWTLPAEFYCYAITAALMATSLFFKRRLYGMVFGLFSILLIFASTMAGFGVTDDVPSPYLITYYFFVGVWFYHYADRVPLDWRLLLACGAIGFALLMTKTFVFVAPIFVAYCTVFVGLSKIPKIPYLQSGDYSYGIYLYGFPITQALVAVAPSMFIGSGYKLLAVSTVLTLGFSVLSWHLLEKKFLRLKNHLPKSLFPMPQKNLPKSPARPA